MKLVLESLTSTTINETGEIRVLAFDKNPGTPAIRPKNNTPETRVWVNAKNLKELQEPNQYFLGVRDHDTGQLVAYGHWEFSRATDRAAKANEPKQPFDYAPDSNHAAQDEMNAGLDAGEKSLMSADADYWHLHMLGVLPTYWGKGAGKLIVRWGQDRAQQDGVAAFLDSTQQGKGMYERLGFVAGKEWNIDYRKYGVNHWNRQWPMSWTPSGKK